MKAAELRDKTISELNANLSSIRREQFKLRLNKAGGEMTKTHKMKELRRDVARINTVINEKQAKDKKEEGAA